MPFLTTNFLFPRWRYLCGPPKGSQFDLFLSLENFFGFTSCWGFFVIFLPIFFNRWRWPTWWSPIGYQSDSPSVYIFPTKRSFNFNLKTVFCHFWPSIFFRRMDGRISQVKIICWTFSRILNIFFGSFVYHYKRLKYIFRQKLGKIIKMLFLFMTANFSIFWENLEFLRYRKKCAITFRFFHVP